ncbi:branched-chain amino acid aminotransferase [Lactobacillus sp. PV012]|uniref:branched-chain amino acid aminotransferase n=1 Tax=Lactobacillus sp. PV012 TaxID=2594494 RepID=UPI00224059BB|nr:branched-chain amino acid aminotransferase [Lactobacillus sp. PV012]QNQ82221.1 branched-chain amino acid aminotransferase [Lactobacillus sp. PV012]
MTKAKPEDFDWNNLGFKYHDLPYSWTDTFKDGQWQGGELTQDSNIVFNEAAEQLHYGQEVFEGLKAYRRKDGGINLFRPEQNAKRFTNSAKRLMMEPYPEDRFVEAVKQVVKANQDFVPPYGSDGTLYIRPFMIGSAPLVGVSPSDTYTFRIYATPVGPYVKGLHPMPYKVTDYDRAAHAGTGQAKTAGNYAGSLLPSIKAKKEGFADCLYLDPREHKYIDEFGGANFYGITAEGQFQTPKSDSILPSITKRSLLTLAQDMGLNPIETKIPFSDVERFVEVGAVGTAAVISPVASLTYHNHKYNFGNKNQPGPITEKLYNNLVGIQNGDLPDKFGWVVSVS